MNAPYPPGPGTGQPGRQPLVWMLLYLTLAGFLVAGVAGVCGPRRA